MADSLSTPHDLYDSRPPTPSTPKKRKIKDLPALSDLEDSIFDWRPSEAELTPLDLYSAGHLFSRQLMSEPSGFTAGLTPSQVYDLNQELLNDSIPTRPLIDVVSSMSTLREEYANGSPTFLGQIDWLISNGFDKVRRTRGDGDCFYRSLAFVYIENLINSPEKDLDVGMSLSVFSGTKDTLDSAGIEKMVYEDFYDELVDLIQAVVPNPQGKCLTVDALQESFQKPEISNSVVIYLRFLTASHPSFPNPKSAQIRLNRDDYEGFVVHPDTKDIMDVDSFCSNIVQAMGKEADNVEIEALCRALLLNVDVAYLNGSRPDSVDFIKFRNNPDPQATPPGHYDILIKNSKP